MRTSLHRRLSTIVAFLVGAAVLASTSTPAFAQSSRPQVIVFGDSLSDPGNGFAFLKSSSTPPDYGVGPTLIPSEPYARGGHHLSNGPTWAELLAGLLGTERSGHAAFASQSRFAMNFALGTARARTGVLPNLAFEVQAFLAKTGGQVPSDALFVLAIGGNDVEDALAAGSPLAAQAILQAAADSIGDTIRLLSSLGAQHFLVLNVPNVGLTPAVRSAGLAAQAAATLATTTFNAMLTAELAPLIVGGLDIVGFDTNALVTDMVAHPSDYGLTNVVNACITPNDAPFFCQNPDEYLFWDGAHPTAAVHAIVAARIAQMLGF